MFVHRLEKKKKGKSGSEADDESDEGRREWHEHILTMYSLNYLWMHSSDSSYISSLHQQLLHTPPPFSCINCYLYNDVGTLKLFQSQTLGYHWEAGLNRAFPSAWLYRYRFEQNWTDGHPSIYVFFCAVYTRHRKRHVDAWMSISSDQLHDLSPKFTECNVGACTMFFVYQLNKITYTE